jgi:hypothetical protein
VGARGYPPLPRHSIRVFWFVTFDSCFPFRDTWFVTSDSRLAKHEIDFVCFRRPAGQRHTQCTIGKTRRRADGHSRQAVHPCAPLTRQWCTVHSAPIIVLLNNTVHRAPYYIYRESFGMKNLGTSANNLPSAPPKVHGALNLPVSRSAGQNAHQYGAGETPPKLSAFFSLHWYHWSHRLQTPRRGNTTHTQGHTPCDSLPTT